MGSSSVRATMIITLRDESPSLYIWPHVLGHRSPSPINDVLNLVFAQLQIVVIPVLLDLPSKVYLESSIHLSIAAAIC